MIQRLQNNLFEFERPATAGDRIFFRVLESFLVLRAIWFAFEWAAYVPRISEVVLALGIANYVDVSFLFGPLALVNAIAMTVFCILGFGRLWRFGYLIALLLFHLQYVARYCLGEISHGSNVIGIGVLALALGAIVMQESTARRRFVMGFICFFIGLGYTSAAFCKLLASGPAWVGGQNLHLWIAERTIDTFSISGSIDYNWIQTLILGSHPLATLVLVFGLVSEFFGFLLWFRRTRVIEGALLIVMHFGVVLSMKISFTANTILLVLIAFPWAMLLDRLIVLVRHRFPNWISGQSPQAT